MSAAQRYFPGTGDGNGKPPVDKSKFAQTCNRLSMFLKEKRNLSFEINAKIDPKGKYLFVNLFLFFGRTYFYFYRGHKFKDRDSLKFLCLATFRKKIKNL